MSAVKIEIENEVVLRSSVRFPRHEPRLEAELYASPVAVPSVENAAVRMQHDRLT
jgi:hypothetical protein